MENMLNRLFNTGNAVPLGFYKPIDPVDYIHGIEGKDHFRQAPWIYGVVNFFSLFCHIDW